MWWSFHSPRAYQGILVGNGWSWDAEKQEYYSDTGARMGKDDERALVLIMLLAAEDEMRAEADSLSDDEITIDEFESNMASIISAENSSLAMLAVGGADKLTDDYETGIDEQLANLKGFASALTDDTAGTAAQVAARAALYAGPGYKAFANAQLKSHRTVVDDTGNPIYTQALNKLDDASQHCHTTPTAIGCPELTERGWIPIEEMVPIGLRQCSYGCRCGISYR